MLRHELHPAGNISLSQPVHIDLVVVIVIHAVTLMNSLNVLTLTLTLINLLINSFINSVD